MNLRATVVLALLIAVPAAGQGIDRKFMDTSVAPCDDFYRYANGEWLDTAEIPGLVHRDRGGARDVRPQPGGAPPGAASARPRRRGDREGPGAQEGRQPLRGADGLGARRPRGPRADRGRPRPHRRDPDQARDLREMFARVRAARHRRAVRGRGRGRSQVEHARPSARSSRPASGCRSATTTSAPTPSPTRLRREYSRIMTRLFKPLGGEPPDRPRRDAEQVMALETALAESSMTRVAACATRTRSTTR